MTTKEELMVETSKLLEQCDTESATRIFKLNQILVSLSAAQMEYLIELSTLLFGQSLK